MRDTALEYCFIPYAHVFILVSMYSVSFYVPASSFHTLFCRTLPFCHSLQTGPCMGCGKLIVIKSTGKYSPLCIVVYKTSDVLHFGRTRIG